MVQYRRPASLDEALNTLHDAGDRGRVLVGGTDLLVGVRRNPLEPLVLVDLKEASDLPPAIDVQGEVVAFGPTATMSNIVTYPQMSTWFPALTSAATVVGSIAIRNRASLVGNLCNASPACDTAPALLVHDASVTIRGLDGERTVSVEEFFVGPGQTQCASGELVVSVTVPLPPDGYRSAFERLTRRRGVDLATVSVAAGVSTDGRVTLGLGAVGPTPIRVAASTPIDVSDNAAVDSLVAELTQAASPISDVRASEEYRRAMTAVLSGRAIRAAHQGKSSK